MRRNDTPHKLSPLAEHLLRTYSPRATLTLSEVADVANLSERLLYNRCAARRRNPADPHIDLPRFYQSHRGGPLYANIVDVAEWLDNRPEKLSTAGKRRSGRLKKADEIARRRRTGGA